MIKQIKAGTFLINATLLFLIKKSEGKITEVCLARKFIEGNVSIWRAGYYFEERSKYR